MSSDDIAPRSRQGYMVIAYTTEGTMYPMFVTEIKYEGCEYPVEVYAELPIGEFKEDTTISQFDLFFNGTLISTHQRAPINVDPSYSIKFRWELKGLWDPILTGICLNINRSFPPRPRNPSRLMTGRDIGSGRAASCQ